MVLGYGFCVYVSTLWYKAVSKTSQAFLSVSPCLFSPSTHILFVLKAFLQRGWGRLGQSLFWCNPGRSRSWESVSEKSWSSEVAGRAALEMAQPVAREGGSLTRRSGCGLDGAREHWESISNLVFPHLLDQVRGGHFLKYSRIFYVSEEPFGMEWQVVEKQGRVRKNIWNLKNVL